MTAGAVLAPTVIPLRIPIPGKLKHTVDTRTPIELHCETLNTLIYYTVDGSKPNPFAWIGCSKQTYKYKNPIYLDAGKQIVKAIAVDPLKNRESPIVTKTFYVEKTAFLPSHQKVEFSEDTKNDEESQNNKESNITADNSNKSDASANNKTPEMNNETFSNANTNKNAENTSSDNSSSQLEDEDQNLHSDNKSLMSPAPHLSDSEKISQPFLITDHVDQENASAINDDIEFEDLIVIPEKTVSNKNEAETKFCECKNKFVRNGDLFFCSYCGKTIPHDKKSIVPSSAQMGICPCCHCHVPMNTPYCIICETRFLVKNHLFIGFKENKICQNCFSINPLENDFCSLCEKNLPNETQFVVPKPEIETAVLPTIIQELAEDSRCEECGRLNSRTARYCDWCGNALEWTINRILECPSCQTSSKIDANFCHNCGLHFQPPVNKELIAILYRQQIDRAVEAKPMISINSVQTDTIQDGATKNQIVQTTLSSNMFPHLLKTMHKLKTDSLPETPLRSVYTISPGRGYWRQQVNHVIAHLKSFAYNNLKFRTQLSQPRLMQLIKGNINENKESIIIQLEFSIKYDSKDSVKTDVNTSSNKENIINKRPSREEQIWEAVTKNISINNLEDLLSSERINLRNRNSDGSTIIHVVVESGRADLIPCLIKAGADLYVRNSDGQPPLHLAILLQKEGLQSVKVFLDLGVDLDTRNKQNQTAYELAVSVDNQPALNLFSAQLGKDMMNQLIKNKLDKQ